MCDFVDSVYQVGYLECVSTGVECLRGRPGDGPGTGLPPGLSFSCREQSKPVFYVTD